MKKFKKRLTMLTILQGIMVLIGLILLFWGYYLESLGQEYLYLVEFDLKFVLPITTLIELIQWYKDR